MVMTRRAFPPRDEVFFLTEISRQGRKILISTASVKISWNSERSRKCGVLTFAQSTLNHSNPTITTRYKIKSSVAT